MLRKGYNIIELLVVITAISLIAAISYQGFNILFDNIKAEGLKTEINKAKTALAKAQAVGSIYWGGNFKTDMGIETMEGLNPLKLAAVGSCNFHELSNGALSNNCDYDNIIYAETELFKKMEEMEFKYVANAAGDGGTFRSGRFPTAKIGFLPNINGYSGIVFTDIPGNMAKRLYEDLNTPKWDPTKDGLSGDRPLLVYGGGNAAVADITTFPTADGFKGMVEAIPNLPQDATKVLDYIGNQPKTTLIYMYTYRKASWQ